VSRIASRTRLPLRLLVGMFGILLLTYLVRRAGPTKLLESMATLGWGLTLVIALGGASHVVKTWAWRFTLLDEKHQVSFVRMFGLRLASEAVGQLGGLAQLFGESLRVSLLSPTIQLDSGIASVALDRAFFVLSAAVISIVGLVAVLLVLPLPHTLSLYAALFVATLVGVVVVTGLAVEKRWPVFSATARILGRVRYFNDWTERKRSLIHSVENKLHDFYHLTPAAFWGSFALNLACHGAAILEVYLILWLMGFKVSFLRCPRHRGFNQTGQYRRHIESRKHRNLRGWKHAYRKDVRPERRRRTDSGIHSTIASYLLGRHWWSLAGRIV